MKICPVSHSIASILSLAALLVASAAFADEPPTLEWIQQYGESALATDVSADSLGNIFVSGILDERNLRIRAFLGTYDFDGNLKRSYVLTAVDSNEHISPFDVWADGLGNAYWVGGHGPSSITMDPFVYKFGPTGDVLWSNVFPFTGNASFHAVTGDGRGNIYLAGQQVGNEGFLYKSDAEGNIEWKRDFLVGNQGVADVAADAFGNIYVSGATLSDFAGPNAGSYDAFLIKFNDHGDQLWARQFGGANGEFGDHVATDREGNVFVAGKRWLNDSHNSYVRKYDSEGNFLWNREFGTGPNTWTWVDGFMSDAYGNVYVSGFTQGNLAARNAGISDVFLRKYDGAGNVLWTNQFGSSSEDSFNSVWVDGVGNIIMAGMTGGNLAAPPMGADAWIALLREYVVGDYNDDLVVDAADYQIWRSTFGSSSELAADGNRNGVIDAADYVVWRNNFVGSTSNTSATLPSVPEPSTLVLGAMALLHVVMRKRFAYSQCAATT